MLVLSRKPNETLLIGGDIEITILEISSSQVRIGIAAPATVPIVRSELVECRKESTSQESKSVSVSWLQRISGYKGRA